MAAVSETRGAVVVAATDAEGAGDGGGPDADGAADVGGGAEADGGDDTGGGNGGEGNGVLGLAAGAFAGSTRATSGSGGGAAGIGRGGTDETGAGLLPEVVVVGAGGRELLAVSAADSGGCGFTVKVSTTVDGEDATAGVSGRDSGLSAGGAVSGSGLAVGAPGNGSGLSAGVTVGESALSAGVTSARGRDAGSAYQMIALAPKTPIDARIATATTTSTTIDRQYAMAEGGGLYCGRQALSGRPGVGAARF